MEEQESAALSVEGGRESDESVHPMAELLEQDLDRVVPKHGDIVEGTIVGIESGEIVVDIGCKSEGIVADRDLELLDPEYRKQLQVGDDVFVFVLRPEGPTGHPVLSLSRARVETDWQKAAKLLEEDEVFEGEVSGCNRGGLIVQVGRVRGFVPASQISSIRLPRNADDEERQELLGQLSGRKLQLKIIEMDRRHNRLILSERAAMREWRQIQKERLLDELEEGTTRHGTVSSLCDFGAFVDLGGADGLIHLSELSWGRVDNPKQVLRVGQEVDVFVLGVDRERHRIALSLKRLKTEPWTDIEERYQIGQLVTGTVTNITDFGAFARLDEDIEGLIHISELSEQRIGHPSEVVREGEEITLRVIRIDAARQRLGLSLRRVDDDQYFGDQDWQESDRAQESDGATEDSRDLSAADSGDGPVLQLDHEITSPEDPLFSQ